MQLQRLRIRITYFASTDFLPLGYGGLRCQLQPSCKQLLVHHSGVAPAALLNTPVFEASRLFELPFWCSSLHSKPPRSRAISSNLMPDADDLSAPEEATGIAQLPPDDSVSTSVQHDALLSKVQAGAVLIGREDRYDGIIVNPSSIPLDEREFRQQLHSSLEAWQTLGKKGVWLQLPLAHAKLVPIAIEAGFIYHHAEPNHVMLTRWLPSTPSTLPPNASHQVGIGAFVMNEKRQVLAIQEKNGPLRGMGVWKMPTGLVNEAEDICDGAVREVKEETGVDTEFLTVLTFRQAHQIAFGKSDLFFVCALRPLSSDITKQEAEIEDAKWMDLEEFRSQAFYKDREVFRQMLDLCVAYADGEYGGFKARSYESGPVGKGSVLYWNHSDPTSST